MYVFVFCLCLSLIACGNKSAQKEKERKDTIETNKVVEVTPTPEPTPTPTPEPTPVPTPEPTPESTAEVIEESSGLSPEFKAAMDSYEAFYTEYVDFMKSAKTDSTLLMSTKYLELMMKVEEVEKNFEKWDSSNLNDEEYKYYIDVHANVLKKLTELD